MSQIVNQTLSAIVYKISVCLRLGAFGSQWQEGDLCHGNLQNHICSPCITVSWVDIV